MISFDKTVSSLDDMLKSKIRSKDVFEKNDKKFVEYTIYIEKNEKKQLMKEIICLLENTSLYFKIGYIEDEILISIRNYIIIDFEP
jgi:hypothetical protein